MFLPTPAENGLKACMETRILPALERSAINIRCKYKGVVRLMYSEVIKIADLSPGLSFASSSEKCHNCKIACYI
jgi:hypothetical protein